MLTLALLPIAAYPQANPTDLPTLHSVVQYVEAHSEDRGLQAIGQLDSIVNAASLSEIKQELPAIVGLTESSNDHQRENALIVLFAIGMRQKTRLPENRREMDMQGNEAIVPYISRLAPRLTDSWTPNRRITLILFNGLAAVRPVPPELLETGFTILQDPGSTRTITDTTEPSLTRNEPAIGPQMLWVLLRAGATYHRDPVTNITEGEDSPEVQEAIIAFLRRSDQTPSSVAESIRALTLAQAQNPNVNGALLRFLDSSNPEMQRVVLTSIRGLTLTPEDYASARARVTHTAKDTAMPPDIQKLASDVLSCWPNDRHHACPSTEP